MEEDIETTEYRLRPMLCELNQLSMPDGSAMLMQGNRFSPCFDSILY